MKTEIEGKREGAHEMKILDQLWSVNAIFILPLHCGQYGAPSSLLGKSIEEARTFHEALVRYCCYDKRKR